MVISLNCLRVFTGMNTHQFFFLGGGGGGGGGGANKLAGFGELGYYWL